MPITVSVTQLRAALRSLEANVSAEALLEALQQQQPDDQAERDAVALRITEQGLM